MQVARRITKRIGPVTVLVIGGVIGCGDSLGPENVTRLLTVDAAQLSGTVGSVLSANPGVRAVTMDGTPVPGIVIRFEVVAGGGRVASPDQTTDNDGVARVGMWTLGPTAGDNDLVVSVPGQGIEVNISATAIAGPPSAVSVVGGNNQVGVAGRPVLTSPTIRVTDEFQNPIAAVPVAFTVTSGGGTLTDGPPIATNGVGEARAPIWSLGPVPGINTLVASAGSGSVTITATGERGPNAIQVLAGADQTATVGQSVPVAPQLLVVDAEQLPFANAVVRFSPNNGGTVSTVQATTDAQGVVEVAWTLGTKAGENRLAASVSDVPPKHITATGTPDVPAVLTPIAGNNQYGEINKAVLVPPAVRVADQFANGIAGIEVTFTVTSGAGNITNSAVTSDSSGTASPGAWILGSDPGAQTLDASIAAGVSTTIQATALAAVFDIQVVREGGGGGTTLTNALNQAALKWRTVIVGDLPSVSFASEPVPENSCGGPHAAIVDTVDDLRVLVYARSLDGIGGTAAQAGPCVTRDSSLLPVLGSMTFDTDDIDRLADLGILDDVALHEMGHILGIGTLWDTLGFLINPSLPGSAGADTHFNGPLAIAAFDSIGGIDFPESKVPVENTRGGQGTRDSHWREDTMTNENMTGFIDLGTNPLSIVTVQSLGDLGYFVNPFAADDFTLPFAAAAEHYRASSFRIELVADILDQPITVVKRDGSITAIIRR